MYTFLFTYWNFLYDRNILSHFAVSCTECLSCMMLIERGIFMVYKIMRSRGRAISPVARLVPLESSRFDNSALNF